MLNYAEEEARGVFQSGNAVFMRNWPYAWALGNAAGQPDQGQDRRRALPKGGADGKHTGALGGWQLAVSKYSQNAELAVELVKLPDLARGAEAARDQGLVTTRPSQRSTRTRRCCRRCRSSATLYDTFTNAVARPSRVTGAKYNQVSSEFFNAVHEVLSGKADAAASLAGSGEQAGPAVARRPLVSTARTRRRRGVRRGADRSESGAQLSHDG